MKEFIRILVAEPIADIQELYGIILDPVADYIEFATDAQEAVAKTDRSRYDLVFLDIGVPELDGLDCAEMVNQQHPDLPVIVSSSIKLPARLAARLLSHPSNFLVNKPFDIKEIRQIVVHACSSGTSRRAQMDLWPRRPEPMPLPKAV